MLTEAGIIYEISFGIDDEERFEEWFPGATVEWATIDGVRRFQVFSGVDGEQKRYRLVFGFEGYDDWQSFVETTTHYDRLARLESIGTDVRTCLWTPSAVTLAGDDPAIVDPDRQSTAGSAVDDSEATIADDLMPEL